MRSIEAEGSTIDEAIANALGVLEVDRSRVEIDILENSTRGVLGIGAKPARVRATVRPPIDLEGRDATVSRETVAADGERAVDVLQRILGALSVQATIGIETSADATTLMIRGADTGVVIGRHGQTLDAIEYLLNRIVGRDGLARPRMSLDVEGYRQRRQGLLEHSALELAAKAKRSGRPVTMNPMSARDRRIVHVALSSDQEVTTRSEGDGLQRRLTIVPVRGPRRD